MTLHDSLIMLLDIMPVWWAKKNKFRFEFEFEWGFYAQSASDAIFRPRTSTIVQPIQSGDNDYSLNETRRKPTTRRQARLDILIPGPLITQSRSIGGKAEMFSSGTRTDNISGQSRTRYHLRHPGSSPAPPPPQKKKRNLRF